MDEQKRITTVDLTQNRSQAQFFHAALAAVAGKNPYRHLFYGGAIRGGKTFVCLTLLTIFCRKYPNSKWYVFRQDFPVITATTLDSMKKIIQNNPKWKINEDRSNYFYQYIPNGSKIIFKAENYVQDKELQDLLGLECNGVLLEQCEELTEKLYTMIQTRVGSWIINPMPMPIILGTFNPSQTWVKERIFEPYRKGELKAPYYFQLALPKDNPFNTAEQWAAWDLLPTRYRRQFIEGDWTNWINKNTLWAYEWDRDKHLVAEGEEELKPNHEQYLYLSFDFNRNPICCLVIQEYELDDGNVTLQVLEAIKLANSNIYALCDYITVNYPSYTYMVTGDASGQSLSALVKDNINYYIVIRQQLELSRSQIKIPTINPPLRDNQLLVNAMLAHHPIKVHKEKAKELIYDFENVTMLPDGSIKKADREDPAQQADLLDCFRYYCNTWHSKFLKSYKQKAQDTDRTANLPTNEEPRYERDNDSIEDIDSFDI